MNWKNNIALLTCSNRHYVALILIARPPNYTTLTFRWRSGLVTRDVGYCVVAWTHVGVSYRSVSVTAAWDQAAGRCLLVLHWHLQSGTIRINWTVSFAITLVLHILVCTLKFNVRVVLYQRAVSRWQRPGLWGGVEAYSGVCHSRRNWSSAEGGGGTTKGWTRGFRFGRRLIILIDTKASVETVLH